MSSYPGSVWTPRTLLNWYKRTFDALKTRTFFAEDYNNCTGEIVAIETDLIAKIDQAVKTTSSPTFNALAVTSIAIGANVLTTSEFGYLDGQDQAVKVASSPTFSGLTLSGYSGVIGGSTGEKYYSRPNTIPTTNEIIAIIDTTAWTNYSGVGMKIEVISRNYAVGQANLLTGYFQFSFLTTANVAWGYHQIGTTDIFTVRNMGDGTYQIWIKGVTQHDALEKVTYTEGGAAVGTVSFASFGVAGSGGSADIAATLNYIFSNNLKIGSGVAATDYTLTFDGETNDGILTWMEDEDYFKFSDDVLMNSTEQIGFNAVTEYIKSANAGYLDLGAATGIRLNNVLTVDASGNLETTGTISATGLFSGDNGFYALNSVKTIIGALAMNLFGNYYGVFGYQGDGDHAGYFDGKVSITGVLNSPVINAFNYAVDAGSTDTYVIAFSPALAAYTTGMIITFKANTINTGAATLNVNGLGAKTIVKRLNTTLANGDILAGMTCMVVYDGATFVLINPVVN